MFDSPGLRRSLPVYLAAGLALVLVLVNFTFDRSPLALAMLLPLALWLILYFSRRVT